MMLSNEDVFTNPYSSMRSRWSAPCERPSNTPLPTMRAAVRIGRPTPSPRKNTTRLTSVRLPPLPASPKGDTATGKVFVMRRSTPSTSTTASTL
jgi:hypothetical protein